MAILSWLTRLVWNGHQQQTLPYHLLMYLHLHDSPSRPIITQYGSVSMPGHYALVHFLQQCFFKMFLQLTFLTVKYKDFWLIRK